MPRGLNRTACPGMIHSRRLPADPRRRAEGRPLCGASSEFNADCMPFQHKDPILSIGLHFHLGKGRRAGILLAHTMAQLAQTGARRFADRRRGTPFADADSGGHIPDRRRRTAALLQHPEPSPPSGHRRRTIPPIGRTSGTAAQGLSNRLHTCAANGCLQRSVPPVTTGQASIAAATGAPDNVGQHGRSRSGPPEMKTAPARHSGKSAQPGCLPPEPSMLSVGP